MDPWVAGCHLQGFLGGRHVLFKGARGGRGGRQNAYSWVLRGSTCMLTPNRNDGNFLPVQADVQPSLMNYLPIPITEFVGQPNQQTLIKHP